MNLLKKTIKDKIKAFLHIFPYGKDISLLLFAKREGISYRGYFKSHEEALRKLSKSQAKEYDILNKKKASDAKHEESTLDNFFHDADYPLLFWLSKLMVNQQNILEFGGSVGHFFYSAQKFQPFPDDINWTIAELPAAVDLGKKLAAKRGEKRLEFMDSERITEAPPADIFVTAGALQYTQTDLPDVLSLLKELPTHVLFHHSPCHGERSFWTLQNLGLCEVPYFVHSIKTLKEKMEALGYEVRAQWKKDRTVEIPFHLNKSIEGYLGFYFELK
jgi:putative methyltransferase (TIGR04325 family)